MNHTLDQQTLRQNSYLPRLERWITSLGIELSAVPSYHSQSKFILEFDDKNPIYVEIDTDSGTLCLAIKMSGLAYVESNETYLDMYRLRTASNLLQTFADHDPIASDFQLCLRESDLMLLLVTDWDQTKMSRLQVHTMLAFAQRLHELMIN